MHCQRVYDRWNGLHGYALDAGMDGTASAIFLEHLMIPFLAGWTLVASFGVDNE
jgi:hypothetical protein